MKKQGLARAFIGLFILVLLVSWMPNVALASTAGGSRFALHTSFDVATVDKTCEWTFQWDDAFFEGDAAQYSHDLAKLSMGMTVSSFRPYLNEDQLGYPAEHVTDFMSAAGFRSLRTDDYDKDPSLYTVSTVIGNKTMQDAQGEYTLMAVGVCGGGYGNEWLSNFSCGDGEYHQGFYSSASEVFDRVFGYIAANNLQRNRIKVWISGFSRAGAISNILAKLLVDSAMFDSHNVFCYTFACPRTTKNPKPGAYPNIFNICMKMDPVPQLPFADWGFDRYGTTLYLPSQQTDSDYGEKVQRANEVYRQISGIELWSNVEWETRLRVILNYLLRIVPNTAAYKEHMQEHIIDIWDDKSVRNIMEELMKIASDEDLINEENRSEANSLLTYLSYAIYGFATQSNIDSRYRSNEATMAGNLSFVHASDVYMAWLFSNDDPLDLFSQRMDYLRVVIYGDVDVAILDGEGQLVKCQLADGTFSDTFQFNGTQLNKAPHAPDLFLDRSKNQSVVLLPKDAPYEIVLLSNVEQTVEVQAIQLEVGKTNGDYSKVHTVEMAAGDIDALHSPVGSDVESDNRFSEAAGDTFNLADVSQGADTNLAVNLERVNVLRLSWRHMIIIAYTLPILALSLVALLVTWLAGGHRIRRKKRNGELPAEVRFDKLPSVCIVSIWTLFLVQELLYWLIPSYAFIRTMMKAVIGIMILVLGLHGYRRMASKLSGSLLVALAFCSAADISINYSFFLGMFFYAIAQGILLISFYFHEKPERWQYIFWAGASVVSLLLLFIFGKQYSKSYFPLSLYIILLMALLSTSLTMPKKVRFGVILLTLGNILSFVNQVTTMTLYGHIITLGIYYLCFLLLAFSTRFKPGRKLEQLPAPAQA